VLIDYDSLVSLLRARNREQYGLPRDGIDESGYVTIGGIEQWVTIRGYDRANPVLLLLHGGPGDVTNPWSFPYLAAWEKVFTVVQWDQRGAGRTLRNNGKAIGRTLTIERMVQDGIELAAYLRKHLGKERIIIVAHAFGTILGLGMARTRPDLFYAYVGTGQVGDAPGKSHAVAYEALLKKACALGHKEALAQLRRLGPPPHQSRRAHAVQRKWAQAFEGADQFLYGKLGLALVAPGGSVEDINDSADGQMLSNECLVPQTTAYGPKELGLDFAVPMFVLQGDEDFTTPTALAHSYLESLKAPQKTFVPIEGGGHFALFMKCDRFLEVLVRHVRPLAHAHH
jgi:pimeloyl-ACP methyl ester carboxylesterase